MADYTEVFKTQECRNWAEVWIAATAARKGLLTFCLEEITNFHSRITSKLPLGPCSKCDLCDVIPYMRKNHKCCPETCQCPPNPCTLGICDKLRVKIEKYHRNRPAQWENTNIKAWRSDPFEIAKCYMTPGHKQATTETVDLGAILYLMLNCLKFGKRFSNPGVVEVLREVCARLFH